MCTPAAVVGQVLWWHMRKEHVIWLLHRILQEHQIKAITVRNDNGSQFIAHAVREYLHDRQVNQEFIHVATPEENCFIEAYHSIIQRELLEPRQFDSMEQATEVFERWKTFYNTRRLHGSLGNNTPEQIWKQYEQNQAYNMELQLQECTNALSTNGERKSLTNCREPFVDKILPDQMTTIFEDHNDGKSQTVLKK